MGNHRRQRVDILFIHRFPTARLLLFLCVFFSDGWNRALFFSGGWNKALFFSHYWNKALLQYAKPQLVPGGVGNPFQTKALFMAILL